MDQVPSSVRHCWIWVTTFLLFCHYILALSLPHQVWSWSWRHHRPDTRQQRYTVITYGTYSELKYLLKISVFWNIMSCKLPKISHILEKCHSQALLLVSCLACLSTVNTDATYCWEMLVDIYQATVCYNPRRQASSYALLWESWLITECYSKFHCVQFICNYITCKPVVQNIGA